MICAQSWSLLLLQSYPNSTGYASDLKIWLLTLNYYVWREHEKNTPFPCDQCKRSYTCERELKWHIKYVHERVKCEECGQEICNLFRLKRHKAQAHGIKPKNVLQCQHCPMFFHLKAFLDKHVATKHSWMWLSLITFENNQAS